MKTLRLTNKSVRILQQVHKIDLSQLSKIDLSGRSMEIYGKLYWAGRLDECPGMDLEAATAETDDMTPAEMITAVNEAIRTAYNLQIASKPEAAPTGEVTDKSSEDEPDTLRDHQNG